MNEDREKYLDAIDRLDRALDDLIDSGDEGDIRFALRCLRRALRLNSLREAIRSENATWQELAANRVAILDALGAPGDWGYSHEVGKALQELCYVKLEVDAEE